MPTNADLVYLDSSALAKLVDEETETRALREFLRLRERRVSCVLARVELLRSARRRGREAASLARELLGDMPMISLDDALLDDAAAIDPPELRSLDAIHLAAARSLGSELAALVTYDARMAAAAKSIHLPVASPH